jgi:hypothetical protein
MVLAVALHGGIGIIECFEKNKLLYSPPDRLSNRAGSLFSRSNSKHEVRIHDCSGTTRVHEKLSLRERPVHLLAGRQQGHLSGSWLADYS